MASCIYVCFFKQKTGYEMRISDWSSDVCSSDLLAGKLDDDLSVRTENRHRRRHAGGSTSQLGDSVVIATAVAAGHRSVGRHRHLERHVRPLDGMTHRSGGDAQDKAPGPAS